MKKKTPTIIIALACAVVLALGCFAVQALTLSGRNAADVALNDVDPFEQNRDASEYYYYWTDENDPNSLLSDSLGMGFAGYFRIRNFGSC